MTNFTPIAPKDLQFLQGTSYKRAWSALTAIKDALQVDTVLVWHLADYWKVPVAEIIGKYKGKV